MGSIAPAMPSNTGIIALAGAVAAAFFVFALNRAVKMKEEERPLAEFIWVAAGLLPLAGVCLIWAATEGLTLPSKIIIFVIGAAIGGFGLLGAGEWLKPTKAAAPPVVSNNAAPPRRDHDPLMDLMDEALADPRYSAATKLVIARKRDVQPFKGEWRATHGVSPEAEKEMKSPAGIAFLNQRLRESGKDWQITPENIASVFGTVMLDTSMRGPFTAGVKITGGGGNTFDQTDIDAMQNGVDLENTRDNSFSNTRIITRGAPTNPDK
jgi:hypothetical protein